MNSVRIYLMIGKILRIDFDHPVGLSEPLWHTATIVTSNSPCLAPPKKSYYFYLGSTKYRLSRVCLISTSNVPSGSSPWSSGRRVITPNVSFLTPYIVEAPYLAGCSYQSSSAHGISPPWLSTFHVAVWLGPRLASLCPSVRSRCRSPRAAVRTL